MSRIMKKNYLTIACLLIIGIQTGLSQVLPKVLDQNNQKIKEIAQKVDEAGWVFFKKEKKLAPDDIFVNYKEAFGLSKSDEMIKVKSKTDDLGLKHNTYQQYYKGLMVEHFTYLIHEKEGVAEIANGELLENIDIDITPSISSSESFNIALNSFKSNKWAWQDKDWEAEKMGDKENPTWKPKGELMIIDRIIGQVKKGVLVYKFDLLSIEPYFHYSIYINAYNGIVEKKVSLLRSANGTVYTLYNDTQSITTLYRGLPNWDYILKDETRGYICTKNFNSTAWDLRAHIDNHENLWHNPGLEVNGATAQWTAEKTYDYYHVKQYRDGIDDNNLDLRIHIDPSRDNSGWAGSGADHDDIFIGQIGTYCLASLDAMGHEFTHGVVSCEAGLVYEKEPGALDESFADIFGTMVEKYIESSTWNWTIGEDFFDNNFLRSMSDPHASYQPTTYLTDGYWFDLTNCTPDENNDHCGVHTNSGIQNHWFYLLSEGGTLNNVTVTSIGTDKAARIAYYNLCYFLSAQSGYASARSGSMSAAAAFYGECSNEYQQVMNAWAAVGVGAQATPCISASISGPTYLNSSEVGTWDAIVTGGSGNYSYTWYVDGYYYSNNSSIDYAFYPDEITEYPIAVSVTDGNLSDYSEIYVTVSPNQRMMSSTNNLLRLDVYPNPALDKTTLQIIEDKNNPVILKDETILIYLVDKSGRVLFKTTTKNRILEINTAGLQKGVYTIILSANNCRSSVNLIIN